jgi:Lon protease-like protein
MSEDLASLPLFPLDTVLFPGMALPLHIFEDRYRLMINECLQQKRDFGVLMARSAAESDGMATVHIVGTSARITHVQRLDDGRMDIMTTGQERFRLLQLLRTTPYIVGRIETFPLEATMSSQVVRLTKKAGMRLVEYLRLVGEVLGTLIEIDTVPREAGGLAYLIARSLQVSLEEKQQLLSIRTLPNLLSRESQILNRETALLKRMQQLQESEEGYLHGPTEYLSLS